MSKLMQNPVLHELKKQASFFIKEKIKTARLAVTDVTAEELWVNFTKVINLFPAKPKSLIF